MKNFLFTTLLFLTFFSLLTYADETNSYVLSKPYENLSATVVKNFADQIEMLDKIKPLDRESRTKLQLQLLNQIYRTRDLDFGIWDREIFYAGHGASQRKISMRIGTGISGIKDAASTNSEDQWAYEENLRVVRELRLRRDFIIEMQKLYADYTVQVVSNIKSTFDKTPNDAKKLSEYLNLIEDEKHRTELKNKLKEILQN